MGVFTVASAAAACVTEGKPKPLAPHSFVTEGKPNPLDPHSSVYEGKPSPCAPHSYICGGISTSLLDPLEEDSWFSWHEHSDRPNEKPGGYSLQDLKKYFNVKEKEDCLSSNLSDARSVASAGRGRMLRAFLPMPPPLGIPAAPPYREFRLFRPLRTLRL